ncbi:hypothetical protein ABPG77_003921 [Micractinium sp. CCAP 211/92]
MAAAWHPAMANGLCQGTMSNDAGRALSGRGGANLRMTFLKAVEEHRAKWVRHMADGRQGLAVSGGSGGQLSSVPASLVSPPAGAQLARRGLEAHSWTERLTHEDLFGAALPYLHKIPDAAWRGTAGRAGGLPATGACGCTAKATQAASAYPLGKLFGISHTNI